MKQITMLSAFNVWRIKNIVKASVFRLCKHRIRKRRHSGGIAIERWGVAEHRIIAVGRKKRTGPAPGQNPDPQSAFALPIALQRQNLQHEQNAQLSFVLLANRAVEIADELASDHFRYKNAFSPIATCVSSNDFNSELPVALTWSGLATVPAKPR